MKHNAMPEDAFRREMDAELSFLNSRPSLRREILCQLKGENVVKKKMSLGMVLVVVLLLCTVTAVAATWHGVNWFNEKAGTPLAIDPEYLMKDMRQNHNAPHLEAEILDAYWDGLELYVAYRVAPRDSGQVLRMQCTTPWHAHALEGEGEADILLYEPEFIIITHEDGSVSHVKDLDLSMRIAGTGWVYEEDGSLTAALKFKLYDMQEAKHFAIPIHYTLAGGTDRVKAYLHCYPQTLPDPVPEHTCQWEAATCVSPERCTICHRTRGGLGWHDFQVTEYGKLKVCTVCNQLKSYIRVPTDLTLRPGDQNVHVCILQVHLCSSGCYDGPFHGLYDEETTKAVQRLQEKLNLEADGICRPEVLEKMYAQWD